MTDILFKQVDYRMSSLVQFIELGQIGLPDIQRPFVWPNTKVRDLFDSMYRGYPVGYLLFWQNAFTPDAKAIGSDKKQKPPVLLVVDGQQRLTSLYAVIKGVAVVREDYTTEQIQIAFNPLLERFEVADAAIRRDKSYVADISALWETGADLFEIVDSYLRQLSTTREVSNDDEKHIKKAFTRLSQLVAFPFTALELSSDISEEQVAEVFVRINSKGTPLNQADFILTLMSVFWDQGRRDLEQFCRTAKNPSRSGPSPYNHFIEPSPDQLLRVSVALGFRRARLQYVYSILRGKDLETGAFDEVRRDRQFETLKEAQATVLNLQHWHDFFKAVLQAGYKGGRLITSQNNLLYSYALYLIGRRDYGVKEQELRRIIARWFFMSSLTGRYTGSPESAMEFDLAMLRETSSAADFVRALERVCDTALTSDFWTISLPNDLATSAPRSPSLFAYYAALVLLDARALFSKQKVTDMLDPSVHANRTAVERHHLFPKGHLKILGIVETRETNQIANYALVEWGDNAAIADAPPAKYVPKLSAQFSAKTLREMYYAHALPDGWEHLKYHDFVSDRRERIAKVIADAYTQLSKGAPVGNSVPSTVGVAQLVIHGETANTEFKSTLRINLHTNAPDARIELACLKTIGGFLNSAGGTLIIGVADDGTALGIEEDRFASEDKLSLHLVNLLKERMDAKHMMYVHPRFEDYLGKRVLIIECSAAMTPVFVRDGSAERFYIRTGPSTTELSPSQIPGYVKQRFGR